MEKYKLIRKVRMDCPICNEVHDVEERIKESQLLLKNDLIDYEETVFYCDRYDDENEFCNGSMLSNNMLNANNAYRRKHSLLTSNEIINIRNQYGLTQTEMAKLLGWGEVTIARYETKSIQDQAYDNVLRLFRYNPQIALEYLKKNGGFLDSNKYLEIKEKMLTEINLKGKEYLSRKSLESLYSKYDEASDLNGFTSLNIDKLEALISYFAKNVNNLYKVKLMKMLWYADALSFKKSAHSMTGLVYQHESMGALPIGHYQILGLDNINLWTEEHYEYTAYRFEESEKVNYDVLTKEDKKIADKVIKKFKDMKSKEIVDYMHKEKAYKETQDNEIISFDLAKEIREF